MNYYQDYADKKIIAYQKFKNFEIDEAKISKPISLNNNVFKTMATGFEDYIEKRKDNYRFKQSEIDAFKTKLLEDFPEFIDIKNCIGPAVYWFTINKTEANTSTRIIENVKKLRKETQRWVTQAKRSNHSNDSTFLYVGKVKTPGTLFNRFIQHLGLGHKLTSSLHLLHWITEFEKFYSDFYFYEVPNEYSEFVDDIENILWSQNKPLLGSL